MHQNVALGGEAKSAIFDWLVHVRNASVVVDVGQSLAQSPEVLFWHRLTQVVPVKGP